MSLPRFHHPHAIANEVDLEGDAVHHARVLRLNPGDRVVLFNGAGGEYEGRISSCDRSSVSVEALKFRDIERESPLRIILAQGISSGDNMDFTVQKAVELGVSRIQPLATRKSVVQLTRERAAKRVQHWQRIVIAACEQCGRNRIPIVERIAVFTEWLTSLSPNDSESRWLLSPDGGGSLRHLQKPEQVFILCGPEGGFTQDEEGAARIAGFVKLKLGPRTLRTETAAMTALAAMQVQWGDL